MNIVDYIVLISVVGAIAIGVFKGVIQQVLSVLGIFFVATLTATVAPYVQNWFANTEMPEGARTVVAMIATVLLLAGVYAVIAVIVQKALKKYEVVRVVDAVVGGVLGLVSAYMSLAVIFSLFNSTPDGFLPLLKSWAGPTFKESWMAQHIFAKNPFGDWLVVDIAQKILDKFTPTA